MKGEEAKRYLRYLGCETHDLRPAERARCFSMRGLWVVAAVLCVGILVGLAVYIPRPLQYSGVPAETLQVVEDASATASVPPESFRATSDAADGIAMGYRPRVTPECVGCWYWIVVGLTAGPGN